MLWPLPAVVSEPRDNEVGQGALQKCFKQWRCNHYKGKQDSWMKLVQCFWCGGSCLLGIAEEKMVNSHDRSQEQPPKDIEYCHEYPWLAGVNPIKQVAIQSHIHCHTSPAVSGLPDSAIITWYYHYNRIHGQMLSKSFYPNPPAHAIIAPPARR